MTGFRRGSDGVPTGFRRGSDGVPTGLRRGSDGAPTGFRRGSDGALTGFRRGSDGVPTGFRRGSDGALTGFRRGSDRVPTGFRRGSGSAGLIQLNSGGIFGRAGASAGAQTQTPLTCLASTVIQILGNSIKLIALSKDRQRENQVKSNQSTETVMESSWNQINWAGLRDTTTILMS